MLHASLYALALLAAADASPAAAPQSQTYAGGVRIGPAYTYRDGLSSRFGVSLEADVAVTNSPTHPLVVGLAARYAVAAHKNAPSSSVYDVGPAYLDEYLLGASVGVELPLSAQPGVAYLRPQLTVSYLDAAKSSAADDSGIAFSPSVAVGFREPFVAELAVGVDLATLRSKSREGARKEPDFWATYEGFAVLRLGLCATRAAEEPAHAAAAGER